MDVNNVASERKTFPYCTVTMIRAATRVTTTTLAAAVLNFLQSAVFPAPLPQLWFSASAWRKQIEIEIKDFVLRGHDLPNLFRSGMPLINQHKDTYACPCPPTDRVTNNLLAKVPGIEVVTEHTPAWTLYRFIGHRPKKYDCD